MQTPPFEAWFGYVLGVLCDELVLRITAGNVADAAEISLSYSERIGHLAQVDAIKTVQDNEVAVGPVVAAAVAAYEGSRKHKAALQAAVSRPVEVSPEEVLVSGKRVAPKGGAAKALAYYDLTHVYTDFVAAILPKVPPPLNSEPDVYEFIGHRLNDTLIAARARLLADAAAVLLGG